MLILDSDPGIDDACAIILAESYFGDELLAVTSVAGNVPVEKTTANALRIKEMLGFSYKVFRGSSKPLIKKYVDASTVHGSDGLGDAGLPLPKLKEEEMSAVEAIIKYARRGKLSLIATGPLTNLAIALMLEPELPSMIKDLTVMGGAFRLNGFGRGNVTAFAEFNFYEDPEAAKIVFESFKDVNVVPLDLTMNPSLWFDSSEVEGFPDTAKSSFVKLITKSFIQRHRRLVLHDAIAVDVHKHREEYELVEGRVWVVTSRKLRGASYLENSEGYHHKVYVGPKKENGFKERFLRSIS